MSGHGARGEPTGWRSPPSPAPPRLAGDERGMLLVLTMVILLVLSMIAGTSLVGALLDRSQVRSQANAAVALHAAEAGIAAGMAWLSDSANLDNYPADPTDVPDPTTIANAWTTNTGWQGWSQTLTRTLSSGGDYQATIRFKRERRDRNGDGDCCDTPPAVDVDEDGEYRDGDANPCNVCPGELVLYNAGTGDGGFDLDGAYFSGAAGDEGYPVVEVEAVGTRGSSAVREIVFFVARNHKAQIEGAFTSRGSVSAGGSSLVDGTNYNSAGTGPGTCGSDLPGITVDVGASAPPCGGHIVTAGGVPCSDNFDPTAPGKRDLGKTPWDVLGISEADFNSLFAKDTVSTTIPQPCSASLYNLWFSNEGGVRFNNSSGCNAYSGIIVVHNERFDPDRWAADCPDAASMSSAYCSDPANQPATFEMNGNVTWTGVVIADQVMLVNGNPMIIGGIFSLASGGYNVRSEISGNIAIKYSCDAVNATTRLIGYKKKLGWQRLR